MPALLSWLTAARDALPAALKAVGKDILNEEAADDGPSTSAPSPKRFQSKRLWRTRRKQRVQQQDSAARQQQFADLYAQSLEEQQAMRQQLLNGDGASAASRVPAQEEGSDDQALLAARYQTMTAQERKEFEEYAQEQYQRQVSELVDSMSEEEWTKLQVRLTAGVWIISMVLCGCCVCTHGADIHWSLFGLKSSGSTSLMMSARSELWCMAVERRNLQGRFMLASLTLISSQEPGILCRCVGTWVTIAAGCAQLCTLRIGSCNA